MKALKFLAAGVLAGVMLASCGGSAPKMEGITKGQVDSASYAVGTHFGRMIKDSNMEGLNYSQVEKGMMDIINGKKPMIDPYQAGNIINAYMEKAMAAAGAQKEKEQAEFMAQNKKNEGVQETESGLQYKIEIPGNDVRATEKDTVEVHYVGTLLDGTVFDSSYERKETVKFPLNRVIAGWTEGMQLVGEGGKITLWVPFNLGYGAQTMSAELPAYSTLKFEVELIKVCPAN